MAGHISYPRTAAVANAWSNYRHAISLANVGAIDASISALRAILNDPNAPAHLKQLAAELVSKLYAQSEPPAEPPPVETSPAEPSPTELPVEQSGYGDCVQIVPDGGLAAHERAAGHTIEKHVEKSIEYLRSRLTDEGLDRASTFVSREQAEQLTSYNIDRNSDDIRDWLGTDKKTLVVDSNFGSKTGDILEYGAESPASGNGVTTVLRKDNSMPGGYRVHTSYPEIFE